MPDHAPTQAATSTAGVAVRAEEAALEPFAARPWRSVVGMAAAVAVGPGALVPFAFGAFIKVIAEEFGWGRGQTSAGISLFTFALAFSMTWYGVLVDRFGPRRPAMASVALLAMGMASMWLVASEIAFLGLFLFMGLAGGGATGLPYAKAITALFQKRRGLAFGLGAAGLGLGGIGLPHFASLMLGAFSWREGFLGLAVLAVVVSFSAALIGLPPGRIGAKAVLARTDDGAFRPWRTPTYWVIGLSLVLIASSVGGIMVHGVALLTDRGMSMTAAAQVISTVAIASIIGRVGGGYLMDIFFAPRVAAGVFLLAACGAALLLVDGPTALAWTGLILIGLVAGADIDVSTYLVSRYCSLRDFGKLFGFMQFLFSSASGVGVYMMGRSFDMTRSYDVGLMISIGLALTAAVLVSRLGPYSHRGVD